jgi:hypothetical protein
MTSGDASALESLGAQVQIWWCITLVRACPGALPWAMRYQPPGPWMLWIQGVLNSVPSPPNSWRQVEGSTEQVCSQLYPRTGSYERRWPWLAGTSYIQSGLVLKKEKHLP